MQQAWKPQPADFDLPNAIPIGAGAISQVYRCKHLASGKPAAVKIISKVQLLQQGKVEAVMGEKAIHFKLGPHPFICRLMGTAQSDDELYFVLEYMAHGDLLQHIRTVAAERRKERAALVDTDAKSPVAAAYPHCLDFSDIRLITAQLVVALERVFEGGICVRDFKPENVCFDSHYRCCLIDFDTAVFVEPGVSDLPVSNGSVPIKEEPPALPRRKSVSEIQQMRKKSAAFCGTAQYVSPEMVGAVQWSYSSDLWALGVVVYQLLYGVFPFEGRSSFAVMKELLQGLVPERHFAETMDLGTADGSTADGVDGRPSSFAVVRDFIEALVRLDPTTRLGVAADTKRFDAAGLRGHALFDGFDWSVLDEQVRAFAFAAPETFFSAASDATVPSSGAPSLHGKYRRVPAHSDTYAEYVFKATDDSNPFDQWVQTINESKPAPTADSCHPAAGSQSDGAAAADTEAAAEEDGSGSGRQTPASNHDDEFSDDEDDVIDDVGVMSVGGTHRDFQM